jgi:hypothetical protein
MHPMLKTLANSGAARLAGLYCAAVFASAIYILIFDWWRLDVYWRFGLGRPLAACGFAAIFWAIVGGAYYYWRRLDQYGRRITVIIGLLLSLYALAFWPGIYDSDSFAGITNGGHIPYNDWLGHAPIITHAILQHIPFLGVVPWIQCLLLALALGYCCQVLRDTTGFTLAPIAALALSAASIPLWYESVQVSRETWLALASLFLTAECLAFAADKDWESGRSAGRLIGLAALSAYLRSEAALSLLVVLVVIAARWWLTKRKTGQRIPSRQTLVTAFAPGLALLVAGFALNLPLTGQHDRGLYDVTLWIKPVGDIIHENEATIRQDDLARIYSVVPRSIFTDPDWPQKGISETFWRPLQQNLIHPPADSAAASEVRAAVVRIVASHPGAFIKSRQQLFTDFDRPTLNREIAIQPTQAFIDSPRPDEWIQYWKRPIHYDAIFPDLRRASERFFVSSSGSIAGAAQWALVPDIALLLLCLVAANYAPGAAFAALAIGVRLPVLLLLTPEALSKYIAPTDFCAPILIATLAGVFFRRWNDAKARRAPLEPSLQDAS